MSEKGSEPDIKQCRFNVSEVPEADTVTQSLELG